MTPTTEKDATSWPARAYAYGTWGYALERAREHAQERRQRVYLYRGALDGEDVWVAAWDPKPTPHEHYEHEWQAAQRAQEMAANGKPAIYWEEDDE